MIQFTVDASQIGPYLEQKYNAIVAALEERLMAIDIALVAKIAGNKLQGNPIKSHTNKLAGSVRANPVENDGSNLVGTVQAGGGAAFYAKFLEDGTRAHQILPVDKKALAFMIGGKQVFAKVVNHPGNRPYEFMQGTLDENEADIRTQLQTAVDEAAGGNQ